MAIVLQGSQNRILMNDGTYLDSSSGGDASSWMRLNDITIHCGQIGMGPSGEATVYFPYSFYSSCYRIIISEYNPAGWATGGPSYTIFGVNGQTTSYFGIRAARKYNGGNMYSPSGAATASWVAIGY